MSSHDYQFGCYGFQLQKSKTHFPGWPFGKYINILNKKDKWDSVKPRSPTSSLMPSRELLVMCFQKIYVQIDRYRYIVAFGVPVVVVRRLERVV